MRNFNLEEARKGATLQTRDGRNAELVAELNKGELHKKISAPLVVKVSISAEGRLSSQTSSPSYENYYTNGKYLPPMDHPLDLFISDSIR